MGTILAKTAVIFSISVVIISVYMPTVFAYSIPSWVKNDALWWGQGQISDSEYIKSIQWLIDNGYIHTSTTPAPTINSTLSVPDVMKSITGEEPKPLGNVYVEYEPRFTMYGEPLDAAAISDYQKFVTSNTVNQRELTTQWTPSANSNSQCSIATQVIPESSITSILHTYVSMVCMEGKFIIVIDSDGTADTVLSDGKSLANNIISQIPNNGE